LAIVQSQAEVPGLVFVAKGFGNLAARCSTMQIDAVGKFHWLERKKDAQHLNAICWTIV
jgi:hypothetical protein